MGRALVVITNAFSREKLIHWVRKAPIGARFEVKSSKRTLPQNDRMWAMLTDVSEQTDWHGIKLSTDDWKLLFMSGLNREVRIVPNLDGTGFVNLGTKSSDLGKDEIGELMDLIEHFGAQRNIQFGIAAMEKAA